MPRPKLVTFDVYMALLDIEGSLTPVVRKILGVPESDAAPFVKLWRSKQMERAATSNSLQLGRTSFRDATGLALDYCLAKYGLNPSMEIREALVLAWDLMAPWPEANAAIAAVKAKGCATAILSNGDQGMLDAIAKNFAPGSFDHVLSSETAGHYKPHPAVYHLPTVKLGIAKPDIIHVAGSANDVIGTIAAGIRCIWSNRHRDQILDPMFPPTYEISELSGIPDLLDAS